MNTSEPIHLLLAEDNPSDAKLTEIVLREIGCRAEVVWVKDGEETLEYLFATGRYAARDGAPLPRLLLLDMQMPRLSGLEVLERLRADPRTHDLPVVVLTSSYEPTLHKQAMTLGANGCYTKPMHLDDYLVTLRQIAERWLAPPSTSARAA